MSARSGLVGTNILTVFHTMSDICPWAGTLQQKVSIWHLFRSMEKMPEIAANGAGRCFFLLIQTLPTFWTEWILILGIFIFLIFWDPKFPDFQVPIFSRFLENRSLFVGRPFFRKLCASKNDAERYRRNILGPNFQKHPLFQFKGLWFLNLRSWYQDLGTRILVPGS